MRAIPYMHPPPLIPFFLHHRSPFTTTKSFVTFSRLLFYLPTTYTLTRYYIFRSLTSVWIVYPSTHPSTHPPIHPSSRLIHNPPSLNKHPADSLVPPPITCFLASRVCTRSSPLPRYPQRLARPRNPLLQTQTAPDTEHYSSSLIRHFVLGPPHLSIERDIPRALASGKRTLFIPPSAAHPAFVLFLLAAIPSTRHVS